MAFLEEAGKEDLARFDWSLFRQRGAIFIRGNSVFLGCGENQSETKSSSPLEFCASSFFNQRHETYVPAFGLSLTNLASLRNYFSERGPISQAIEIEASGLDHDLFFLEDVTSILSWIALGPLKKLVAVANKSYQLKLPFDPVQFIANCLSQSGEALKRKECVLYGVWGDGKGVLGLSPEILFESVGTGERWQTMALAGTISQSIPHFQKMILNDPKELGEHQWVVDEIFDQLLPVTENLTAGETYVVPYGSIAHLRTDISFEWRSASQRADGVRTLIELLAPTPALGGYPRAEAEHFLRKTNSYRHLHGEERAFGGIFSVRSADYKCGAVAIRNVEWQGRELQIASGVGVVADSQIENEYREMLKKRETVEKILIPDPYLIKTEGRRIQAANSENLKQDNLHSDEFKQAGVVTEKVKNESVLLEDNLGRLWSSLIVDELVKWGIKHFYISPGMRNAPLIAACVANKAVTIFSGLDERGEAYRALGHSKATGIPGVLICTSGTALANYMPAVIEAKKSQMPLFIISADRPPELTFSDANQTINQNNFYGPHVEGHLNLGVPTESISPAAIKSSVANLIFKALYPTRGPVHLNFPLREPLGKEQEKGSSGISESYLVQARDLVEGERPTTQYYSGHNNPTESQLDFLWEVLNSESSGLLVIGNLPPFEDVSPLRELLRLCAHVPKYLDVGSSLKLEFNLSDNIIPSMDHPEVFEGLVKSPPEFIVHLGGRLVSEFYYRFLNLNPKIKLITINDSVEKEDPSHFTKHRLVCAPRAFAAALVQHKGKQQGQEKERLRAAGIGATHQQRFIDFVVNKRKMIDEHPLTYPSISKSICDLIPEQTALYLGNSTVIRSFDSYSALAGRKTIKVVNHRGASGIEGLVAAATGYFESQEEDVVLVVGDVSFLHDLSSLVMLKRLEIEFPQKFQRQNFLIVLVNNNGGGIFSLFPIAKEKEIIDYMRTPHDYNNFRQVVEGLGIDYQWVSEKTEFEKAFLESLSREKKEGEGHRGAKILEVKIDDAVNTAIYEKLKTIKL